jgi:hypothetical protein
MKLSDARKAHEDISGIASATARNLAFAGIAIVWIFKADVPGGGFRVPLILVWASFALICGLACDLLQYVYGAAAWGLLHRIMEKKLHRNQEKDFGAPIWINWPTEVFFWFKIVGVAVGYLLILIFLFRKLQAG